MIKIVCSTALLMAATVPVYAQLLEPQPSVKKAQAHSIYNSIVRVEVSTQVPNYYSPWEAGRFSGGTGTGFLIGENTFMTNAHVVSDQRHVQITKHGSAKKYPVRVKYVAHDCDLAILELTEKEDIEEFKGLTKLEFNGVPKLESHVRAIGYPVGGDRISVTRGVVSRIDFRPYAHSRIDSHLVVQVDAAINPGNSGGPVLQEGKVVGVAFQGLTQADNTGYMIPTPVIKRFLKDIEDGNYDEYVDIGASTFPLFNEAMREALKLPTGEKGVLVTSVTSEGSSDGVLKKGDVILTIDGHKVDESGNITLHGERVDFNEVVERKFVGDTVKFEVLRNGEKQSLTITLKHFPQARMYAIAYGERPRYTIKGGLLFQPLNRNLYSAHRLSNPRVRTLYANYLKEEIFKKRKDIVILTRVLKHAINTDLTGYAGLAVSKINGLEVVDLDHAHELLNPEKMPEHIVIECDGLARPLILPGKRIQQADEDIQQKYAIKKLSYLSK